MPQTALLNLGLNHDWDAGDDAWKAGVDNNWALLDAFALGTVIDQRTAQPGAPAAGDAYITGAAATGAAWSGHNNELAVWNAATSAWVFAAPTEGWAVYDRLLRAVRRWDGTRWLIIRAGRENLFINGAFDVWQRGTSQTLNGYGSDDRWSNEQNGSTKTHTRQIFVIGQSDVPGQPVYYSRTVVVSNANGGNYVVKIQKIEGVRHLEGELCTLSFLAKADSPKNIASEFEQRFGTGGAPSARVLGIGVTTHALTTSWQKFTAIVSMPSITGKTLGNDDNDSLTMNFWFEAGSNFDSRTNNLGQQSGTFDIANVRLEPGGFANEVPLRTVAEELALCQRYFEKSYALEINPGTAIIAGALSSRIAKISNIINDASCRFAVRKRVVPTITWYSTDSATPNRIFVAGIKTVNSTNDTGETATGDPIISVSPEDGDQIRAHWTADAEL